MISGKMSKLEKREFITRSKALSEEEQDIVARLTPTDILQSALRRRKEFCTDILKALTKEIAQLPDEPTIQEMEKAIKACKGILRLTDKVIR